MYKYYSENYILSVIKYYIHIDNQVKICEITNIMKEI